MTTAGNAEDYADIVVAGGGPSGAAVAWRLARLGYDVRLIAGPPRAGADRLEILPPGLGALAGALPLSAPLAHAAEPLLQKHLRWSGAPESLAPPQGTLLVHRAPFDAAFLDEARKAGVGVMAPATARRPRRDNFGWAVPIQSGRGNAVIRARVVADATGRISGLGNATLPGAPPTLAVSTRWSVARPAAATLLVEAAPGGWCWGAAAADGTFDATVFVDRATETKLTRAKLMARHLGMLRDAALFAPVLRDARMLHTWVCDATPRAAAQPAGAGWIKVGDAALSADPLSSQGVQAALRSALQAAAVIHTILSGGDGAPAIAFYRTALAALSDQQKHVAATLYGTYPDGADDAFWRRRQGRREARIPPHRPAPPLAVCTPITRAQAARVGAHPALLGDRIGIVPAIHVPGWDRPAGWLNGVAVTELFGGIEAARTAGDIASAWSAFMPPDEAWSLLSLLTQNGVFRILPDP